MESAFTVSSTRASGGWHQQRPAHQLEALRDPGASGNVRQPGPELALQRPALTAQRLDLAPEGGHDPDAFGVVLLLQIPDPLVQCRSAVLDAPDVIPVDPLRS